MGKPLNSIIFLYITKKPQGINETLCFYHSWENLPGMRPPKPTPESVAGVRAEPGRIMDIVSFSPYNLTV